MDDTFRTFEEAKAACAKLNLEHNTPTLPVIHAKEEADFLAHYLFSSTKKVDNFWLGSKLQLSPGGVATFKWVDNTELTYTNWVSRGTRNRSDYCVQIEAEPESQGKWADEPCEKKNAVVCQKRQIWSLDRLQESFLSTRNELRGSLQTEVHKNAEANRKIAQLMQSFENLQLTHIKTVSDLKQSLLPVGFIYAQLPNEDGPAKIWPWATWQDVSATYKGVFFRILGENSAAFGETQEEASPRLTRVERIYKQGESHRNDIEIVKNSASDWIYTGDDVKTGSGNNVNHTISIRFITSGEEVRPRNMAIRVWKRIA